MILFIYDHTFEGLLTCIFDAYFRKTFPDLLLMEGEPLPLFYNEAIHIATDEEKAGRVWRGLQKKISKHALFSLTCSLCGHRLRHQRQSDGFPGGNQGMKLPPTKKASLKV